jgi:hypothetical protein
VLLGQALETSEDLAALRAGYPELAHRVEQLRSMLRFDTASGDVALPMSVVETHGGDAFTDPPRMLWVEQWDALLSEVRSQPGWERFGLPLSAADLREAAGSGTIVAINITDVGCGALILDRTGSSHVPLPELTDRDAVAHANRFLAALHREPDAADPVTIREVLGWLWDTVAEPVLAHLGFADPPADGAEWPRIWWIPTGPLSALPLHAAGHHGPDGRACTVLDRVVSSYTPTVRTLFDARSRSRSVESVRGTLIVGLNAVEGLPTLDFAEAEAVAVQRVLGSSDPALLGADATVDAVVSGLRSARWQHFACHAIADGQDPTQSALVLHDGELSVERLTNLDLSGSYLAMLSACDTATGSVELADESIHIASAFQVAGCTHAVATMWFLNDGIAPYVTEGIYDAIAAGMEPAHAVHHAIRAIRAIPDLAGSPHLWAAHIHFGP